MAELNPIALKNGTKVFIDEYKGETVSADVEVVAASDVGFMFNPPVNGDTAFIYAEEGNVFYRVPEPGEVVEIVQFDGNELPEPILVVVGSRYEEGDTLVEIDPAIKGEHLLDLSLDDWRTVKTDEAAPTAKTDAVNPAHYKQGRVEVIEVIEDAVQGAAPFEAVCQGNVLKYTLRYRHKNGIEDLKKARWYLDKLIETLSE